LREVDWWWCNQTAMLEVFGASKSMFAQMIAVDVLLPIYGWGFTLWGQKSDKIDKWLKADNSPIAELEKNSKKNKVKEHR
jgi:hypothetical protein